VGRRRSGSSGSWVVEERRIEVRIVTLLAQGLAGVAASLALLATQLVGLPVYRAGLAGAAAPPLVVRDVDALRLGDEEIVFGCRSFLTTMDQ